MRRGARRSVVRSALCALGFAAAWPLLSPPAGALPPPLEPRSKTSAEPSAEPTDGAVLPYGSPLFFVLDDKISSASTKPGTVIHMHLKSALVVNGVTLAPSGAPETLQIITARPAHTGDEDGAVDVHFDPFPLPGRQQPLPVRALHEYLTMERTAGNLATRDTTDTIGDIFIPGHELYHMFRPGQQLVLPPGAVLRAFTAATIDASNTHSVVLTTPPPFESTFDTPHSDLTAAPMYTPAPMRPRPLPRGKPTLPPTPVPTPEPTAAAASSAPASAAPASAAPVTGPSVAPSAVAS